MIFFSLYDARINLESTVRVSTVFVQKENNNNNYVTINNDFGDLPLFYRHVPWTRQSGTGDSWSRPPETVCGVSDIRIRWTTTITNCTAVDIPVRRE